MSRLGVGVLAALLSDKKSKTNRILDVFWKPGHVRPRAAHPNNRPDTPCIGHVRIMPEIA
jgi:hypothetical protein